MIDKEIQFITDFSLNTIKTLGSSFTMNNLFNIDLHPALVKYISGRLDYMIFDERKILLEKSRFDYSGAKTSEYFNLISEEIKKTKKLSFSDVEDYVKKGVVFNANFCVKPKSTLTGLIYKDSDAYKSTSEIKVYLRYLYYYDYYTEIINLYINKKKMVHLSMHEFSSLLDKIDEELLSVKKEEIISDAINSISDFFNIGSIGKSLVHLPLVEAYLKEKDLIEMIENLSATNIDIKKKMNVVELKKILFTPRLNKEERKSELIKDDELREIGSLGEIIPDIEFEEESYIKKEIEVNDLEEKIPEFKTQQEKNIEENEEVKQNKEMKVEKKEEKKDKVENESLVKSKIESKNENLDNVVVNADDEDTYTNKETILEEEILDTNNIEDESDIIELIEENNYSNKDLYRNKDLFSFLTQKDIDKIISSIFNDDEDDFANTLERISECNSYEQAAEILESVFYTYKVNPYKREAVSLTNAVSNYFNQD